MAARLVDFPEPVGPVTRKRPRGRSQIAFVALGRNSSSTVFTLIGITRSTAPTWRRCGDRGRRRRRGLLTAIAGASRRAARQVGADADAHRGVVPRHLDVGGRAARIVGERETLSGGEAAPLLLGHHFVEQTADLAKRETLRDGGAASPGAIEHALLIVDQQDALSRLRLHELDDAVYKRHGAAPSSRSLPLGCPAAAAGLGRAADRLAKLRDVSGVGE